MSLAGGRRALFCLQSCRCLCAWLQDGLLCVSAIHLVLLPHQPVRAHTQHPVKHKTNNLRALPYLGPFPWSRLPPRMEQKADQAAPLSRAWASHAVSQLLVWFPSRRLGSAGGQESCAVHVGRTHTLGAEKEREAPPAAHVPCARTGARARGRQLPLYSAGDLGSIAWPLRARFPHH